MGSNSGINNLQGGFNPTGYGGQQPAVGGRVPQYQQPQGTPDNTTMGGWSQPDPRIQQGQFAMRSQQNQNMPLGYGNNPYSGLQLGGQPQQLGYGNNPYSGLQVGGQPQQFGYGNNPYSGLQLGGQPQGMMGQQRQMDPRQMQRQQMQAQALRQQMRAPQQQMRAPQQQNTMGANPSQARVDRNQYGDPAAARVERNQYGDPAAARQAIIGSRPPKAPQQQQNAMTLGGGLQGSPAGAKYARQTRRFR